MVHKNIFLLLLILLVNMSCGNKDVQNSDLTLNGSTVHTTEQRHDSIYHANTPTESLSEDSILRNVNNTNEWSMSDFIITCPQRYLEELQQEISRERELWKDVSNPFIATYKGNDFGDYHYINFEDSNGKSYDFGRGKNDLGAVQLFYNDEQMNDNPKYMKQEFKIFWDWRTSSFPCCSGDYETIEAYMPSIIRLELVKMKIRLDELSNNRPSKNTMEWYLNNYKEEFISTENDWKSLESEDLIERKYHFKTKKSKVLLTLIFCKNQTDALTIADSNSFFRVEESKAGINGAVLFIVQGKDQNIVNDVSAWFAGEE